MRRWWRVVSYNDTDNTQNFLCLHCGYEETVFGKGGCLPTIPACCGRCGAEDAEE